MELIKRKKLRIDNYNYDEVGSYFITICSDNKEKIFCTIDENIANVSFDNIDFDKYIKYTDIGNIIKEELLDFNNKINNVVLENYIIMPNHIHLLITIDDKVKTSIPKVIMSFKRNVTLRVGKSIWQRSYYDRVIRNNKEKDEIIKYIIYNPFKWKLDEYYM